MNTDAFIPEGKAPDEGGAELGKKLDRIISLLEGLRADAAFLCFAADGKLADRRKWEEKTGMRTTPSVVYVDSRPPIPGMPPERKERPSFFGLGRKKEEFWE